MSEGIVFTDRVRLLLFYRKSVSSTPTLIKSTIQLPDFPFLTSITPNNPYRHPRELDRDLETQSYV